MSDQAIIQTPLLILNLPEYAHQIMKTVSNMKSFFVIYHFRHLLIWFWVTKSWYLAIGYNG